MKEGDYLIVCLKTRQFAMLPITGVGGDLIEIRPQGGGVCYYEKDQLQELTKLSDGKTIYELRQTD